MTDTKPPLFKILKSLFLLQVVTASLVNGENQESFCISLSQKNYITKRYLSVCSDIPQFLM